MATRVIVIGAGFAGLASATCLAKAGYEVTVLEKNATLGGRARMFEAQGFRFDMGPSWYWMPDVFEQYFALFGKQPSDYYELMRLDPSYRVFFSSEVVDIPAKLEGLYALFERYEAGSSQQLKRFLDEAAYKYEVGMQEFVHKPAHSIWEFADLKIAKSALRLHLLQSMSKHIKSFFKHPRLIQLLEFPVLFLGATPENTPALYSMMNYADLKLGTWYPKGGMHKIVEGMVQLAQEQGVQFLPNEEVIGITINKGKASSVQTSKTVYKSDIVIGSADYQHLDQEVLDKPHRQYSASYWDQRVMAPSSLLFYLGINKRLKNLQHHNLFFDQDFGQHATEIYEQPQWPSKPLFYACCPSISDPTVAPVGHENLFLLVPVAPDLEDTEDIRAHYYNLIMDRLERLTGQDVRSSVIYKRSYAHKDFKQDYHAFKGNAYGLANTLRQTAFLKPKLKSTKVENLYYAGQLTVPGPGVPPSLISGQIVANEIINNFKS